MDQATHNKIVSFIWGIVADVLRDLFKRGKYPDVIQPMCVLRRLDAVLEPTKKAVLETLQSLASDLGLQIAAQLYGQEINPETYAICKADMVPLNYFKPFYHLLTRCMPDWERRRSVLTQIAIAGQRSLAL